jgi:hypothetical protein
VVTLNEKPVRLLMHDMIASMGLAPGQPFTREQAVQWFAEHLLSLSLNRISPAGLYRIR